MEPVNTVFAEFVDGGDANFTGQTGLVDIHFSPGETYVITYDFVVIWERTGFPDPQENDFGYNLEFPSFGTIDFLGVNLPGEPGDTTSGAFTWTITEAQWMAAGSPGSVAFDIVITPEGQHQVNSLDGQFIAPGAYGANITCFAPGTAIKTPTGETAVETLKPGDLITTADGRTIAVAWIGRQTVSTIFQPPERRRLIRICANALRPGVPDRDLFITADHALLIQGVLCNAGALVNGRSIRTAPMPSDFGTYTVYHIETETHDVILANATPAETFVDTISRQVFDNHRVDGNPFTAVPPISELAYPRVLTSRQLPASIRAALGISQAA